MTARAGRLLAGLVTATALFAAGCGIPTSGSPTAIAKADVPVHLLDPVTPATVNPTISPSVAVPELIYLVDSSQHVIAVSRDVEIPAGPSEIIGALLDGPTAAESDFGLQSFLTGTNIHVAVTVAGGVATVDFTSNPFQVVGPDQTLAIAQVVYTATQLPDVKSVIFEIDGQRRDVPIPSGVQVPGPVDRSTYQAQAPLS